MCVFVSLSPTVTNRSAFSASFALPVYGSYSCVDAETSDVIRQGHFTSSQFAWFALPTDYDQDTGIHYLSNMKCWFNFTAPQNEFVYVMFMPCSIELSTNCLKDRFVVPKQTGPLNEELSVCGSCAEEVFTSKQQADVKFVSDDSTEEVGCVGIFLSCKCILIAGLF